VSEAGRPLSRSAISKIFTILRRVEGLKGEKLSSHQLRHTFNENLSKMFDASGTSDENEKKRGPISTDGLIRKLRPPTCAAAHGYARKSWV